MKKNVLQIFIFAVALIFMADTSFAQKRGDDSKQKSKNAEAMGQIGDSKVRVTYGAPHVKGRTIFGGLEKWDKIWRAGANEATTVTFSKNVKVAGKDLAAGTYAFFVTPQKEGAWTVIFNSEANQWGAYNRSADKDVLTVEVAPMEADHQEILKYSISNTGDKEGTIDLHWATTKLAVPVASM